MQQLQLMALGPFPCHSSSLIRGIVIGFGIFSDFAGNVQVLVFIYRQYFGSYPFVMQYSETKHFDVFCLVLFQF